MSACSSSGIDRLSGDTSGSDDYNTASVTPADYNVVQAQPLDGGAGTKTFSARPVQSVASTEMPPAAPVLEPAPEPAPQLTEDVARELYYTDEPRITSSVRPAPTGVRVPAA